MQTYDAALEKIAKEMGYRNAAEFADAYAVSRRPENIAKATAEFRQDRMRQEEDRLDEIVKRNAPRTTSEAELTELVKRHVDRHGGSEADAYCAVLRTPAGAAAYGKYRRGVNSPPESDRLSFLDRAEAIHKSRGIAGESVAATLSRLARSDPEAAQLVEQILGRGQ